MRPIYVLYEDQRGPTRGFGLHELLVSSVADSLRVDRREISDRLRAIPKRGDSKLLAACSEAARIGARGEPVVALFDDDRLRTLLKLPHVTSKREVAARICDDSGTRLQLVVWLLVDNTETLVGAVADCLGVSAPAKSLLERDRMPNRAVFGDARVRAAVRERVPSFSCFVRGVVRLWSCA